MIMYNRLTMRNLNFIIIIVLSVACAGNSQKPATENKPAKKDMADLNRFLIQKDKERIQNYIERKNLRMTESPTGLWYQIVKEGTGEKFTEKDKIVFNYKCSLLDGTECYNSDNLGPKEVALGRSEIEPGLNEGLRMLGRGAEAIFILPPYLAYGLLGDRNKIPSRAVVVYYVNIIQTK
jgi:FKBP-type peptidyl-prolyl cis-trans isomerase FkpA